MWAAAGSLLRSRLGGDQYRRPGAVARRVLPHNHEVTASLLYDLACLAALQGKREDVLTGLRQAIDHGFRYPDHMANAPDLKSLHGDPRFIAMLEEVRRLAATK